MAKTEKPHLDYCKTERPKRNDMKVTVEMTADTFYEFMQFQKGVTNRSQRNLLKENEIRESDLVNVFVKWTSDSPLIDTTLCIFKVSEHEDKVDCLYETKRTSNYISLLEILEIVKGDRNNVSK